MVGIEAERGVRASGSLVGNGWEGCHTADEVHGM